MFHAPILKGIKEAPEIKRRPGVLCVGAWGPLLKSALVQRSTTDASGGGKNSIGSAFSKSRRASFAVRDGSLRGVARTLAVTDGTAVDDAALPNKMRDLYPAGGSTVF